MALIDPICAPFVLQMGRIQATNGALSTPKPPQKPSFVCKIGGTSTKKRANCPFFNDFCVPQNAWDKPGTTVGHGTEAAVTAGDQQTNVSNV